MFTKCEYTNYCPIGTVSQFSNVLLLIAFFTFLALFLLYLCVLTTFSFDRLSTKFKTNESSLAVATGLIIRNLFVSRTTTIYFSIQCDSKASSWNFVSAILLNIKGLIPYTIDTTEALNTRTKRVHNIFIIRNYIDFRYVFIV